MLPWWCSRVDRRSTNPSTASAVAWCSTTLPTYELLVEFCFVVQPEGLRTGALPGQCSTIRGRRRDCTRNHSRRRTADPGPRAWLLRAGRYVPRRCGVGDHPESRRGTESRRRLTPPERRPSAPASAESTAESAGATAEHCRTPGGRVTAGRTDRDVNGCGPSRHGRPHGSRARGGDWRSARPARR